MSDDVTFEEDVVSLLLLFAELEDVVYSCCLLLLKDIYVQSPVDFLKYLVVEGLRSGIRNLFVYQLFNLLELRIS